MIPRRFQAGDDVMFGPYPGFRVLFDPPQDLRGGIDSYKDYYNGVPGHRAAGIMNKAFWYVVTVSISQRSLLIFGVNYLK